jgi:hypothetical protein
MKNNLIRVLVKIDEKPITFISISDNEVKVCYGSTSGQILNGDYYPPVGTIHSRESAQRIWNNYVKMGWREDL